jgi:hypothetical protein
MTGHDFDWFGANARSDGVDFGAVFVVGALGREDEYVYVVRRWYVWAIV